MRRALQSRDTRRLPARLMLEHEMSHFLQMKRELYMEHRDIQQYAEQHAQREERKLFHSFPPVSTTMNNSPQTKHRAEKVS